MNVLKILVKAFICLLPWRLKRYMLRRFFDYQLHPSASIGLAWIYPAKLIMAPNCRIDHFSVAIHLDRINMEAKSTIGRGNWITGFSTSTNSPHFQHQSNRRAELHLGESAAITKYHHLDCTSCIEIGRFTTIAGYHSQLLTHSIDVIENRQDSAPIHIGEYAFIGTNVVVLGGASLPARSVLGAKSLLNKAFDDEWMLYAGVPAKPVQAISKQAKYFSRLEGFVH